MPERIQRGFKETSSSYMFSQFMIIIILSLIEVYTGKKSLMVGGGGININDDNQSIRKHCQSIKELTVLAKHDTLWSSRVVKHTVQLICFQMARCDIDNLQEDKEKVFFYELSKRQSFFTTFHQSYCEGT
jgi:hypothetical protein